MIYSGSRLAGLSCTRGAQCRQTEFKLTIRAHSDVLDVQHLTRQRMMEELDRLTFMSDCAGRCEAGSFKKHRAR